MAQLRKKSTDVRFLRIQSSNKAQEITKIHTGSWITKNYSICMYKMFLINSCCSLFYRYFTKGDLKELFEFQDSTSSMTQRQLQNLHSKQRDLAPDVAEHLAQIHVLRKFSWTCPKFIYSDSIFCTVHTYVMIFRIEMFSYVVILHTTIYHVQNFIYYLTDRDLLSSRQ